MRNFDSKMTRRVFAGSALAGAALLAGPAAAAEQALKLTEGGPLGPFYPVDRLAEDDADLTWLKGHGQRALGDVIEVTGRVLDMRGNPVSGARLELWQCNAAGRYAHAADVATAPLDPNFQGFAALQTGAKGDWRITTIKPASYDSPIGRRTPHIHFDIKGKSYRLISQMYFSDDDVSNSKDRLYQQLGPDAGTAVAKLQSAGKYHWDIVLMEG
jgi:protocatechuate 3,4-dioxygenase, beta subunit